MHTYKSVKRQRSSAAVDGIIRTGRTLRPDQTARPIRRTTSYRPEVAPPRARATAIGDFRQPTQRSITDQARPLTMSGTAVPLEQTWNQGAKEAEKTKSKKKKRLSRLLPFRRKKEEKKPRTRKQKVKRGLLIFLVLALLGGGFLFAKTWMNARKILPGGGNSPALQDCEDLTQLNREGDCRVNIMLLGKGGGAHEAPDLTDTIMLASIDPVSKEAVLLSIPRDLYVQPEGQFGYTKINAVYANAKNASLAQGGSKKKSEQDGLAAIEKTLENKLQIPIHYYGIIDFTGFKKAIDTVGGISIDVKKRLYDPTVAWENNWNPLIADVGVQKFNGARALLYARSRHGTGESDFDRGRRQREVLVALKDKIFSAGTYSNPVKVTQLLDNFGNHIETNFSINEIMKLYGIGKDMQNTGIKSVGLTEPPNDFLTTGMYNGQSVVLPKAGIDSYAAIQKFVRKTLIDPRIKQENAQVMVLNGTTTAGLATTKAELLKSYGYNIGEVTDAPTKDYEQTVIIDLRSGDKKYTKHYLERRFNTSVTGRLPDDTIIPGTADFVIIIGRNETSTQ